MQESRKDVSFRNAPIATLNETFDFFNEIALVSSAATHNLSHGE